MQKKTFFDKAKKVIEENPDMLAVFEEFDRTGRFRKRTYKIRPSFTLDEDLFNRYRNYCKKNGISMSARIENFIKQELQQK
ncbi:hypothetical protein KY366_06410 [Candidatus Woesearchaeota archaeon]|nr:hypothetical protein [Candidatus Woesearchaeota archaeon]